MELSLFLLGFIERFIERTISRSYTLLPSFGKTTVGL